MKKLLQILLISLCLLGCASLELGDALSSEQYTQQILDLGLTHEENLEQASKLKTPHLVSVVTLQLTNARDVLLSSLLIGLPFSILIGLMIGWIWSKLFGKSSF